ncbi:MAG TPA: ATP-binding protein [Noviherbaspirillum sp.]|jgi:signal transduction histidine kinase|uniref:ATP-binding protein n=1 Tax=Noviherbaspirillum sp. TaxID=1926288 RepID=UPI002DDD0AB9|nr:ATP-binding protein [Noviherbaspirillum sp.]HEV2610226.1 ATP-binding protein [Noviherbaspirillum sp.]
MNRIFYRIFPLIVLAIAVAAVAIYFLLSRLFGDPLEDIARKQAAGPIFLLEQYIDQAPPDEWLVRLNKVREVSGLSLELVPLDTALPALDDARRGALQRGDIVLDIAGKSLLRRVDLAGERYVGSEAEVLHVRNLPIDVGLEIKMEALRYLVVALCVLVPIALWSRSHWLELLSLSQVADRFGEGRLSVRARTRKTSGLYPLSQRMNQMAERIEGLLGAHRDLLHSVSHEVRTPIARIEFSLELLRDAASADEREKRIQLMEDDLRELNALINELLQLTRLDQPQAAQVQRFSLAEALHDCAARLEHAFAGKRFVQELPDDLGDIAGDRRLIARAVGNLLANGAKYAQREVRLSAASAPGRDGDWVEVAVDDDGPGIPPDARERIFEPFYRLDRSRDRTTGGFGLGLAIARKAVQLHGGTITVADSPLGGAKFILRLPRGVASEARLIETASLN